MAPPERHQRTPFLDAREILRAVSFEAVLKHFNVLETLKGRGDQLTGLSPFRDETTHSFSANISRGIWTDHAGRPVIDGREVSGNAIGFTQAWLDKVGRPCSFRDALLYLHEHFMAGAPAAPKEREAAQTRGRAQQALREQAATVTENVPFGKELTGLRYDVPFLQEKGFDPAFLKKWGIGLCPKGLMRGRIVYPIRRPDCGTIVGYAGRAITPAEETARGRYRFPEGMKKGRELFAIDRLVSDEKMAAKVKEHGITIVEGFHDAMRLQQHGYAAVALMGVDFHEAQRRLLLEHCPGRKITLMLDHNEAGIEATRKIARELVRDFWVRIIDYGRVEETKTEPEHMDAEDLRVLFGVARADT